MSESSIIGGSCMQRKTRVQIIKKIIEELSNKQIDLSDERVVRLEAHKALETLPDLTSIEQISLENMIVNQTLVVKINSREE